MAASFGELLSQKFIAHGQLCVGIDPHKALLESWGVGDSISGLRSFSLSVVEAAVGLVGIVKPQVSFFERFGASGFEVLAEVSELAHQSGLLVIADAKRGDIGTTMDAYLEAWFDGRSGLFADALTVSPYLGLGAISSGFERFAAEGKAIFSLVATSNPEGESVQLAKLATSTLAASQLEQLDSLNSKHDGGLGPFGAVIGATLDFQNFGIDLSAAKTPILAPGFGAQGARLEDATKIFQNRSSQVIYSVSRSVLVGGEDQLRSKIEAHKDALNLGLAG